MPALPVRLARSVPAATRVAALLLAVALAALALAPAVLAEDHDISIGNDAFEPAELTVVAGEPVTWTNASDGVQTVTSDDGTELDSGDIGPGEAYGHVYEMPGSYAYHSEANPKLKGTIKVVAAPVTPEPSGPQTPAPPEGTLPPNFSPFPPPRS